MTAVSRRGHVKLAALAASLPLLLAACGSAAGPGGPAGASGGASAGTSAGAPAAAGPVGTVVVLAAASLTDAFTTLGRRFEQLHPGVRVQLSFGGSDGLAAQVVQGAPADVFAAASQQTMSVVQRAGDVAGSATVFARNEPEVAVPPDNPAHIATLADVTRPGVKLGLCAPTVPCGVAARKVFAAAGLTPHPVTLEQDVRSLLTKVELGELDAGLVYRTDVRAAGDRVKGIPVARAAEGTTSYPIAVLTTGGNRAAAQAFVDYVESSPARDVLTAAGFDRP